jgi:hypothetical protein
LRSQSLSSRGRFPDQRLRHEDPPFLCASNPTAMEIIQQWCTRRTCLLCPGLTSGPVAARFTGRQKTLCGRDSLDPVRVSRSSATLARLNIAFLQRVAKLK